MPNNSKNVTYRAIANFSDLSLKVQALRKQIAALRQEEEKLNAASAAGSKDSGSASNVRIAAAKAETAATKEVNDALNSSIAAKHAEATATKASTAAHKDYSKAASDVTRTTRDVASATKAAGSEVDNFGGKSRRARQDFLNMADSLEKIRKNAAGANTPLGALSSGLNKIYDALGHRSSLGGLNFNILIQGIGGLLGLVNPLVAGLGAAGAAALGFGNSLGSLAGTAIGILPALTAVLSVVGAVKTAFSGIGGALKAYANKNAYDTGLKGSSGASAAPKRAELTDAEKIARANQAYARSVQDVQFAEEDLTKERKDYIQRLNDLQKAVDREAVSEARAQANRDLAKENLWNVLADPGSTKGQKEDASAGLSEAINAQTDTIDQGKQNAADLADMKKKGMEGDRQVIQAERGLEDAINAVRDAQLGQENATYDSNKALTGGQGAINAANQYKAALDKLSPSAKKFVLWLIGMKPAWDKLQKSVQEKFFSQFVGDMDLLKKLLPPIQSGLETAAGSAGKFVDNLIKLVTSDGWIKDLETIGKGNGGILDNIGRGLLAMLNTLKDLIIISQPFTTKVAGALADAAEDFEKIVATSRDNGSLAKWLDTVYGRLGKWVDIVKNLSLTIFNYFAAASDLGDSLTTSFDNMTKGWLQDSKDARKEGSPFKTWLEETKPAIHAMSQLIGAFFSWFHKEATDPKNIKAFTDILDKIRTDLGPAVGKVIDSLSKNGVGQAFVDALSSIADAIATLMDNGGAKGIKDFWGIIKDLADAFKKVADALPPGVLSGIVEGLLVLNGLKFVGLFSVLGALTKFVKGPGLGKLLSFFIGAEKVDKIPLIGAGKTATGGGIKAIQTGKSTSFVDSKGTVVKEVPGTVTRKQAKLISDELAKSAEKTGGKLATGFGKTLKVISKGAKGGILGAIIGIVGDAVGGFITGPDSNQAFSKSGVKEARSTGGSFLSSAATGAGLGSLGGPWGMLIGALAGGTYGVATNGYKSAKAHPSDTVKSLDNLPGLAKQYAISPVQTVGGFVGLNDKDKQKVIDGLISWTQNNITDPIKKSITDAFGGFHDKVITPLSNFASNVSGWWDKNISPPWKAFVGAIGRGWNQLVAQPLTKFWSGVSSWFNTDIAAPIVKFWSGIASLFNTYIGTPIVRVWSGIASLFNTYIGTPIVRVWTGLASLFHTYIGAPIVKVWSGLSSLFNTYVGTPIVKAWSGIGSIFNTYVGTPVVSAFKTLTSFNLWTNIKKVFTDWLGTPGKQGTLSKWIEGVFNGLFKGGDVPTSAGGKGGGSGKYPVEKRLNSLGFGSSGLKVTSDYRTPAENAAVGGVPGSLHTDKDNPAVDIAGSKAAMDKYARFLGQVGGWRQLYYDGIKAPGVSYWPGHYDHIHVANTGGQVPGHGNGDIVPARLTPGEFVLRKAIVKRIGPENLARLNSGVLPYAKLLKQQAREGDSENRNWKKNVSFFAGGGLVPGAPTVHMPAVSGNNFGGSTSPMIGQLVVNNPVPEPTSTSLPAAIRKASYISRRPLTKR